MYGNLAWAILTSQSPGASVTNVCKFLMAPLCVAVGQLASQYGAVCARCMWGVAGGFSLSVPSLASVSAILFPIMHVWALTLLSKESFKFDEL